MRTGTVAVALAGAVLVGGITYAFIRDSADAVANDDAISAKVGASSESVHVDELADSPERFDHEVTLRAVVSAVNKSQGVFSVIDSREFESCGVLTCAKHNLPVKFTGPLPEPKTVVEITGQVVESDRGLVFDAKRVDVVP